MNTIVGGNIKKHKKLLNFTQEQMADNLHISQSAYARIESGESNSWSNHLAKLSEIFEIQPEDLLKIDSIVVNQNQQGGHSNNAYIINQLSEKLIDQYEKRISEKERMINMLENKFTKLS